MATAKAPAQTPGYVTKTPDYKPGAKSGKRDELTMFYRVKPGHEKEIRKAIEDFHNDPVRTKMDDPRIFAFIAQTGVHDLRHVLFENDTRLAWLTSFDTDWDPYIDDTFAVRTNLVEYGKILQHTVEAPEGVADPNHPIQKNSRAIKDLFLAQRVVAAGYAPTFPNATTWGIRKGEKLLEAFQKVLDHPQAEEALKHPALKPLLELASE
jgi:hypothetical protein